MGTVSSDEEVPLVPVGPDGRLSAITVAGNHRPPVTRQTSRATAHPPVFARLFRLRLGISAFCRVVRQSAPAHLTFPRRASTFLVSGHRLQLIDTQGFLAFARCGFARAASLDGARPRDVRATRSSLQCGVVVDGGHGRVRPGSELGSKDARQTKRRLRRRRPWRGLLHAFGH